MNDDKIVDIEVVGLQGVAAMPTNCAKLRSTMFSYYKQEGQHQTINAQHNNRKIS